MIKISWKRVVLQLSSLVLITAGLYGCSGDGKIVSDTGGDTGGQQRKQAVGRYVESEVALPAGATFDSVISFQNGPGGAPLLFTRAEKNGVAEFTGYLLSDDLTWEERDCGWLNQLELPYVNSSIGVTYGEDGKLYAAYSEGEDQDRISRHHVVVTEDWENGQEIELLLLSETNEMGYVYFPSTITALKNGNLLFDSGRSVFLYDEKGQRRITKIMSEDGFYIAREDQFYTIDGESGSLISYDGENGTEKSRYPLELDEYYGVEIIAGANGDLSLISRAGIQILKNGSDIWEQIIEGKRYTMGSPKYYPLGFAEGNQKDYFVYYGSMDETCKLTRYVYNPDMPVEPETELTIFALRDNPTIRQAVSVFQIENPNVKVEFQPLMEEGDTAAADDYIRTLNTELLAGEGPDILILDGLSEASYIEKGVLEDVTEEIEALVSSGDFLENIAQECRVDGNIYSVPVRIGLPMTFGRKDALSEAGQLKTLADLVQSHEHGQIFGTVDRDSFLSLYADAFLGGIVSEDGVIQEQRLKDFLLQMKLILDGGDISDGTRENRPTSMFKLLEDGTYLHTEEVAGFFQSEAGISIVEQAKGELEADMIALNRTYLPYGIIGINRACENKEMAAAFLRTALSEEVQSPDFYDGFAVNKNVLEILCGIERNSADGYGGPISGADGRTYEMKLSWPTEPLRRQLLEFCKAAEHSAGKNWKVKQIVLEYSKGYFDGNTSLEEVTSELMTKITLYLQE